MAKYPTIDEIQSESENNSGWCTVCEAWTHDCCEPDARKYTCPECGNDTCYGAEEMAIMGMVSDDDSDDDDDDSWIDEEDDDDTDDFDSELEDDE